MAWVIFWVLCGIASSIIAGNKGRSGFAWLLFGCLLGPFGILLALLVEADACYAQERAARLIKISTFWTHDLGKDTGGVEGYVPTKEPNESETDCEIAQLRHEVKLLGQNVARLEAVLTKRFDTISAQLEPLRDLTEIRKNLDAVVLKLFGTLK